MSQKIVNSGFPVYFPYCIDSYQKFAVDFKKVVPQA